LAALQSAAGEGTRLIALDSSARQVLARIVNATSEERSLRSALAGQAASAGLPVATETERLEAIFDRLDAWLRQAELAQKARLEARDTAMQQLSVFNARNFQALNLREAIQGFERDQARVSDAFNVAEKIRADVRQVLVATSNTRAKIVSRP